MLQLDPTYVETEREGRKVKDIVLPNPYLCIGQNREDIYYQDGEFYKGKNEPPMKYEDVPDWFWHILRTSYDAETIKKWRIVLPENRVKTKEEKEKAIIAKSYEMWKCPEPGCGEELPVNRKGTHIMKHRRKEKGERRRKEKMKQEV